MTDEPFKAPETLKGTVWTLRENRVAAGPPIGSWDVEVVPLTALQTASARVQELEGEQDEERRRSQVTKQRLLDEREKVREARAELKDCDGSYRRVAKERDDADADADHFKARAEAAESRLARLEEALEVARRALVLERDERMAAKRDAISTQTAIASVDAALTHSNTPREEA